MCIYIYMYRCVCVYVCINIYIIVYKIPVFHFSFFITDLLYNHNPHYYIFWFHCLAVLLPNHFFLEYYIFLYLLFSLFTSFHTPLTML